MTLVGKGKKLPARVATTRMVSEAQERQRPSLISHQAFKGTRMISDKRVNSGAFRNRIPNVANRKYVRCIIVEVRIASLSPVPPN